MLLELHTKSPSQNISSPFLAGNPEVLHRQAPSTIWLNFGSLFLFLQVLLSRNKRRPSAFFERNHVVLLKIF
jgi:hypothetical protein